MDYPVTAAEIVQDAEGAALARDAAQAAVSMCMSTSKQTSREGIERRIPMLLKERRRRRREHYLATIVLLEYYQRRNRRVRSGGRLISIRAEETIAELKRQLEAV